MSLESTVATLNVLARDAIRYLLEPDDLGLAGYRGEFLTQLARSDFRDQTLAAIYEVCADLEEERPAMWEAQDVIAAWTRRGNLNASADITSIMSTVLPPATQRMAEKLLEGIIEERQRIATSEAVVEAALTAQHDGIEDPHRFTQDLYDRLTMKLGTTSAYVFHDAFTMPTRSSTDWVLQDLLCPGEVAMFSAQAGSGKSTLLRQFAFAAANGLHPWTGQQVPGMDPETVLLLDFESHGYDIKNTFHRMKAQAQRHLGIQPVAPLVRSIRGRANYRAGTMDQTQLRLAVRQHRPKLVCLGPLKNMFEEGGGKETWSMVAGEVQGFLMSLADEFGFAIAIEAHGNRADVGSVSGSQRWQDWPDVMCSLDVCDSGWETAHSKTRSLVNLLDRYKDTQRQGSLESHKRVLRITNRRGTHRNPGAHLPLGIVSDYTQGPLVWEAVYP